MHGTWSLIFMFYLCSSQILHRLILRVMQITSRLPSDRYTWTWWNSTSSSCSHSQFCCWWLRAETILVIAGIFLGVMQRMQLDKWAFIDFRHFSVLSLVVIAKLFCMTDQRDHGGISTMQERWKEGRIEYLDVLVFKNIDSKQLIVFL